MTTSNQALAKRFIDEVINRQNLSVIDETMTNDFTYIDSTIGTLKGRDTFKDLMARFFVAFPNLVWTVEQEVSEGDTIVSRYSWTATNDGEYRSMPATHKTVTANGVAINRFSGGKLAETRMVRDDLGLMRQLGVIPEQPSTN
jgi:steroid delta-isomerase-like uncharacterized protein